MDMTKITQKVREAINEAQSLALGKNSMSIMPEHLLKAVMSDEEGLVCSLLKKCGVDVTSANAGLDGMIDNIPAVTGSGREPGKIYVDNETDVILTPMFSRKSPRQRMSVCFMTRSGARKCVTNCRYAGHGVFSR